ncbi:hypothetical protein MNBD_ALPHA06-1059, partial [hydrothermal vent metagenome]
MAFKLSQHCAAFLAEAGWGDARVTPLVQDASTRRYFRLQKTGGTAILLSAPMDNAEPLCQPQMTAAERDQAGYTAMARLAGNDCVAFLAIARELSNRGFSAPVILHAKPQQGLILLEDLGDDLFAQILDNGQADEREIYGAAITILAALARASFATDFQYQHQHWQVIDYDRTALLAEVQLFCQWYLPHQNIAISDAFRAELLQAWEQVLDQIDGQNKVLVLRD